MTRVLGLMGGIASGKSTVARLLAGPDGLVVSADELAHEVLSTPEVTRAVRDHFGPEALDAEGRPDRRRLAELVFDPQDGAKAKRLLEDWIHPGVRARILEVLSEARAGGVPRVVLDVPLLIENDAQHGLLGRCDVVLFVDADGDERDRRAQRTRGWAPGEVARREAAQFPLEEKRRRADFVVPNNGSLQDLERATRELLSKIVEA